MTAQELNTYIDKVLGNSLRCLLPSYWWKRLLKLVVGYVESVDAKVDNLKDTVDNLDVYIDLSEYLKSSDAESTYATKGELSEYATKGELSEYATKNELRPLSDAIADIDDKISDSNQQLKNLLGFTVTGSGPFNVKADGKSVYVTSKQRKIKCTKSFNVSHRYLTSIDTSLAYTSEFTSMRQMFYNCSNLVDIDVSTFDTSRVTDMSGMFMGCTSLEYVEIKSLNKSKVTDMSSMFEGCSSLDLGQNTELGDISNVVSMSRMFYNCVSLGSSGGVFRFTSTPTSVTDLSSLFEGCSNLASFDWSQLDTTNVTNMDNMFKGCTGMIGLYLDIGFFKTRNVTSIDFSDLSEWDDSYIERSLVLNSYDRAGNGLPSFTVKLHPNAYARLTDDHKATMTAKGYVIEVA